MILEKFAVTFLAIFCKIFKDLSSKRASAIVISLRKSVARQNLRGGAESPEFKK